jgi:hypothetical protein
MIKNRFLIKSYKIKDSRLSMSGFDVIDTVVAQMADNATMGNLTGGNMTGGNVTEGNTTGSISAAT